MIIEERVLSYYDSIISTQDYSYCIVQDNIDFFKAHIYMLWGRSGLVYDEEGFIVMNAEFMLINRIAKGYHIGLMKELLPHFTISMIDSLLSICSDDCYRLLCGYRNILMIGREDVLEFGELL